MAYERKYKVTHTIKDCFRFYKKDEIYSNKLTFNKYKQIAYEINKTIADLIIRESFEYRIPHGLGFLRIKKKKLILKFKNGKLDVVKNIIDWKSTWDYWEDLYKGKTRMEIKKLKNKKVFFLTNEHTNGDIMRWYWDKRLSKIKNIRTHSFKPVKGGIREGRHTGRHGLRDWVLSNEKRNEYYY